MKSGIIEVSDLWYSYGELSVLEDVNLSVQAGDFIALIGPNGGGKTTLLKLMLGILTPDSGTINVLGMPPRKASKLIGYVPQETGFNTSFPISVFHVVLMGRMHGGGGWRHFSKNDRMLAEKALKHVQMWEYREHPIEKLSGGQKQRVFTARALVTEPEILFMDEPASGVDTKGQTELYNLLNELNSSTTIIIVSHDLGVISSYVKSLVCVNRQLIFHDKAEITGDMLEMAYHCPVDLIAHGKPHRVLQAHSEK